jgi:competence protein ComEA
MPIRSFRNSIKDYFTFKNQEKKPILLLIALVLISPAIMIYIKFIPDNSKVDFSAFEKEIEAFEKQLEQDSILAAQKKMASMHEKTFAIKNDSANQALVFKFNPNKLPDSLWLKLGIREKVVKTIKKYESKGGQFYKKEDLKKIYGFDEKDYARLEYYIAIPPDTSEIKKDSLFEKAAKKFHKYSPPMIVFDLNTVSTEELKSLNGIGDVKANSIVKYRSMLGGFCAKEQLHEAYGIDSALYEFIKNHVEVKAKNLRTININTAYEPELRHPYISKQLAAVLVNYRKMHGNFKSLEEIKKVHLINDELYLKLAPYLSVN